MEVLGALESGALYLIEGLQAHRLQHRDGYSLR